MTLALTAVAVVDSFSTSIPALLLVLVLNFLNLAALETAFVSSSCEPFVVVLVADGGNPDSRWLRRQSRHLEVVGSTRPVYSDSNFSRYQLAKA